MLHLRMLHITLVLFTQMEVATILLDSTLGTIILPEIKPLKMQKLGMT